MAFRVSTIQVVAELDSRQLDSALASSGRGVKAFADTATKEFQRVEEDINKLGAAFGLPQKEIESLKARAKDTAALGAAADTLNRLSKSAGLSSEEIKKFSAAIPGLNGAMRDLNKGSALFGSVFGQVLSHLIPGIGISGAVAAGVRYLTSQQAEATKAAREYAGALQIVGKSADGVGDTIDKYARSIQNMTDEARQFAKTDITRVLVELAYAGRAYREIINDITPLYALDNRATEIRKKLTEAAGVFAPGAIMAASSADLERARAQIQAIATEYGRTKEAAEALKMVNDVISLKTQLEIIDNPVSSLKKRQTVEESYLKKRQREIQSLMSEVEAMRVAGLSPIEQIETRAQEYLAQNFPQQLVDQWKGLKLAALDMRTAGEVTREKVRLEEHYAQVRVGFERDYLRVVKGSESAQIESIRTRVDEYKKAGVSVVELTAWQGEMELQYSRTASAGMIRSLRDYAEEATNTAKNLENLIGNSFSSLEDMWVQFCTNGKFEFSSFANSVVADIARIATREAITGPLAGALSSFAGGLFGGGGWGGQTLSNGIGITNPNGALTYHAKGGIHPGSVLGAYSNSIVNKPTFFAFARGGTPNLGLMGEKPGSPGEAIMPLSRMRSGNLGVEVSLPPTQNSALAPVNVNIAVHNNSSAQVAAKTSQDPSGGMRIDILVDELDKRFARRVESGQSQTGMAFDRSRNLNRAHALYRR